MACATKGKHELMPIVTSKYLSKSNVSYTCNIDHKKKLSYVAANLMVKLPWIHPYVRQTNHWKYYPKPVCFTEKGVKQAGGQSLHPIELGTSDCLPSHPQQKMVKPQTAVSPLLALISLVC